MKIYVTHSRSMDYKNGLYLPIRQSHLNRKHEFILPHELSDEPFNSRSLILGGSLGLLIAEISIKSTAQGVEIGWADASNVPVAFFYKPKTNPSNALRKVTDRFIPYSSDNDLIKGIENVLEQLKK